VSVNRLLTLERPVQCGSGDPEGLAYVSKLNDNVIIWSFDYEISFDINIYALALEGTSRDMAGLKNPDL
jgi:hypothetical protein